MWNTKSERKIKDKDYVKEKEGIAENDDSKFLNGAFWILKTGSTVDGFSVWLWGIMHSA